MDNDKVKEIRRRIESVYGGLFTADIARQFDCELRGLLKGIYRTPLGGLSHYGVERSLRKQAHDAMNKN